MQCSIFDIFSDLLSRLRLHSAAAYIRKYSSEQDAKRDSQVCFKGACDPLLQISLFVCFRLKRRYIVLAQNVARLLLSLRQRSPV